MLLSRRGDLGRSGIAIVEGIVTQIERDLSRGVVRAATCNVCRTLERRAVAVEDILIERIRRPEGLLEFEGTFGLCQPHVLSASGRCTGEERRALIRAHGRQLERLVADLRRHAEQPEARAAATRALAAKLAGR